MISRPQRNSCNFRTQGNGRRLSLRAIVRSVLLSGFLLFPAVARAQEEGARFQRDPVEQVAVRVLVAGALALPLLITGVGTILVFQRAERVEFCASCHLTMKPFVDDLKNPTSNSLAALHFRNRYIPDDQCYSCHTSYGLFGTVEAKKEGLNDVYKYYTRTFHLPIKLRHPYPNTDCLKCHAGSAKWIASHEDYKDALFSGEASCMQC